jgi:hypothetical protein
MNARNLCIVNSDGVFGNETRVAAALVERGFYDDRYGWGIKKWGVARYTGSIPQQFDFSLRESLSTRQMC